MGEASLNRRADALCEALGYVGRSTYFASFEAFDRDENLHLVKSAFEGIGVHSVFGLSDGAVAQGFKPVVYVCVARDEDEAVGLHRRVWTQGAIPRLIVVTPGCVQVRDAFNPPSADVARVAYQAGSDSLPEALRDLSASSLVSSIHWKDVTITRDGSIDSKLVSEIERINRYACGRYPHLDTLEGRMLVNALVGRLMYLYVLIDRGLVDARWMRNVLAKSERGGSAFAEAAILKDVRIEHPDFGVEEVWSVLDGIDSAINGCVFPIPSEKRGLLPADLVHLVHRVVRWGEAMEGSQISFLDVSFGVLRTETISAIYERFLRVEDGDAQRADGAFYTPPYLADFVVSQMDGESPFGPDARIIDPAAGSGVFLVAAYRRIMERSVPSGGWSPAEAPEARRLLQSCVFGIEKNAQAANVCRFSLYLTMLDYVAGVGIDTLAECNGPDKLFPSLDDNIAVTSAFAHPFGAGRFTHVVGNPPWLRLKRRGTQRNVLGAEARARERVQEKDEALETFLSGLEDDTPVIHGRISDAFVWLASSILAEENGIIGLILPTTSLVGRQSGAFSTAVATKLAVRSVANLSYLRYQLFSGSKAPATVVIAAKRKPIRTDFVNVYRPRLSSLPLGRGGDVWALFVSQTDIQSVRSLELQDDTNGWFAPLILGALDRRTRQALRTVSEDGDRTVAGFLDRSGLRIMRGGNEEDSGFVYPKVRKGLKVVPANLVALPDGPGPEVKGIYRPLFSGNVLLVPRNFRYLRLLAEPHAFNSSFYAIASAARWSEGAPGMKEKRPPKPMTSEAEDAALAGLLAFFESGVAGYFAALYGATVLLDGARFEKRDILAMPFPFGDSDDPAFRGLQNAPDVDAAILDALGAGSDLRKAVADFMDFSRGYADARLPEEAFDEVDGAALGEYVDRFGREMAVNFTARLAPRISVGERRDGVIELRVSFGFESKARDPEQRDGTFVAASVISFDREAGIGLVKKTSARFAWMSDQAVEDAGALVRLVAADRG